MSATPIQVSDEAAIPRPRLLPMFDPLLLLGAVGLIACSLVTLKGLLLSSEDFIKGLRVGAIGTLRSNPEAHHQPNVK